MMPPFRSAGCGAAFAAFVLVPSSSAQFLEPGVQVLHTITGEAGGDQMGWAVAGLRDIDGDGAMELICPAPGNDAGGNSAGRVYVRSGRTGVLFPGMTFTGSVVGGRLGAAIADAGDVNDDGVWDVVCGGPGPATTAGRIVLFSGAGGAMIRTVNGQAAGDGYGYSVAGVGDLNNDGFGEVLVGAPGHDTAGNGAGRAYIVSGFDGTTLRFHDGEDAGDRFGCGAASTGDLNGDGIEDYIVGANLAGPASRGRAYVYSGATGVPLFAAPLEPGALGANFGEFFVAGLADVDGDGDRDVYVGDYGTSRAYVFNGGDGHLVRMLSGFTGLGCGRGAGDVDGDGREDLAIGAYGDSLGAAAGGSVVVFRGYNGAVLRKVTGTVPAAQVGFDAVGIGDVNRDGRPDLFIGAAGTGGNVAYVVAGAAICAADCTHDGQLTVADFGCFQTAFVVGDPATDCNGDGQRTVADFGCFQTAFVVGCP